RWRDGEVTSYTADSGFQNSTVNGLCEDREGAVWAATTGGLWRLYQNRWDPVIVSRSPATGSTYEVVEDGRGRLWVSTSEGLFRREPGARRFEPVVESPILRVLRESRRDERWEVADHIQRGFQLAGIHREDPAVGGTNEGWHLLRDHDGNLWIGTPGFGLFRLSADESTGRSAVHRLTQRDGLSNNTVRAIFEDTEGN